MMVSPDLCSPLRHYVNQCVGEIDIVEGVNDQTSNQMTLHTNSGPRITKTTTQQAFTGQVITENCDVNAPDQSKNAGCAIADDSGLTFGSDFNTNGGGVYATEWTSEAIKIWYVSPHPTKNNAKHFQGLY